MLLAVSQKWPFVDEAKEIPNSARCVCVCVCVCVCEDAVVKTFMANVLLQAATCLILLRS